MENSSEIRVCMDIGSKCHYVGIGLSTGELLEEFELLHTSPEIENFFTKIAEYEKKYALPVTIAMEAYNGYARPIDQYALSKGYRVLNVNNHKLANYKKVFPGPAKTDAIDMQKMFELFCLGEQLPIAKNALQEVHQRPEVNEKLKRLTRRRSQLVDEKMRLINRLQGDLQAASPGLLDITKSAENLWFLRFLTSRDDLRQLARIREKNILRIKGLGKRYLNDVLTWQKTAKFSAQIEWMGEMLIRDAQKLLELLSEISQLEKYIEALIPESEIATRLQTIPGFGPICSATLAGEIGTLARFNGESSLALYTGMGILNNSSGEYTGTKKWIHVNKHCKSALMIAVARHINHTPESKIYYDKKRTEGKKHNQAVRALGRHMIRVIWSMLSKQRDYELRD